MLRAGGQVIECTDGEEPINAEASLPTWEPPDFSAEQRLAILTRLLPENLDKTILEVPSSKYRATITRLNCDVADDFCRYVPRYNISLEGESPNFTVLSTGELGSAFDFEGNGSRFIIPDEQPIELIGPYMAWADCVLEDLNLNGIKVS